ncbi:hypothetical protein F5Y17DRAFT_445387 [Xylariaceae sp. FL0594]|nr:hypothetical protein F5Y17DRAFT_445387 [Xylariaceae sp. FL0594]
MVALSSLYEKHGIPIVLYDQIGCGRSTHLPDKTGDAEFWTFELFIHQLEHLIDHLQLRNIGFHLVGQSWGGMLGAAYASLQASHTLIWEDQPRFLQLWRFSDG